MWYTLVVQKAPSPAPRPDPDAADPENQGKRVPAIFYRTETGGEPVRKWLRELSPEDRKRIGELG